MIICLYIGQGHKLFQKWSNNGLMHNFLVGGYALNVSQIVYIFYVGICMVIGRGDMNIWEKMGK